MSEWEMASFEEINPYPKAICNSCKSRVRIDTECKDFQILANIFSGCGRQSQCQYIQLPEQRIQMLGQILCQEPLVSSLISVSDSVCTHERRVLMQ